MHEPGVAEISWSLATVEPGERAAVCVRATDDPQIVLLEMMRGDSTLTLRWFLHRSVLRSLSSQLAFWRDEYGAGSE